MQSHKPAPHASDETSDLLSRIDACAGKVGAKRVSFQAGEIVIRELGKSQSLYIVAQGKVQILAGPGREVLATSGPGDILGELSFIDDLPHTASAVAKTSASLIALDNSAFSKLAALAPELAYDFNRHLLRTIVSRQRSHIELERSHRRQAARLAQLAEELNAANRELAEALEQTRATQAELIAASRLATVGQLASGMAHELNSPVAAMLRGSAQLGKDLQDFLRALPGLAGKRGDASTDAPVWPILMRMYENASGPDLRSHAEVRQARRAAEKEILKNRASLERAKLARLARLGAVEDAKPLLDAMAMLDDRGLEALETIVGLAQTARSLATCAERVDHVVRALQGYSRVDQEQTTPTDIREGIHDTLALFTHAFKSGISLETDLARLPNIEARPAELNQVWTNLVQNAVQAMRGAGTLTVRTRIDDNFVKASFHDTGGGIAQENLERIFDLNFSTRRGEQRYGFGVGLAVARTIIEAHGGRIAVDSRPGDTTFGVWLPQSNDKMN